MASGCRDVRHYRALAFMLILIVVSGPLTASSPGSDGQAEDNGYHLPPTRSLDIEFELDPRLRPGDSLWMDDLNDGDGIGSYRDSVLKNGAISLEGSGSPLLLNITDIHLNDIDQTEHGIDIVMDGSTVFIGYCWERTDRLHYSLIGSTDGGENWSDPVNVMSGRFLRMGGELLIWEGDLYLFLLYQTNKVDDDPLLVVRSTSLSTWWFLANAATETLVQNSVREMDVEVLDGWIFLGAILEDDRECLLISYDGVDWESDTILDGGGSANDVALMGVGEDRVLFFFSTDDNVTDKTSDGHVYLIDHNVTSTVKTSPVTVMDGRSDYLSLETVEIDGSLVLFANRLYGGEIDIIRSDDGGQTWSGEETIVSDRGLTDLDVHGNTYSVGESGGTACLTFEGSCNRVRMIYGLNGGRDWLGESDSRCMCTSSSFNPLLPGNGTLMLYLVPNSTGADINIRETATHLFEGTVEMRKLSAPSLERWREMGVNATIPAGASVGIRIHDERAQEIIFPGSGWFDISGLEGGSICGMKVDHILDLQETDVQDQGSISIEFLLKGSGIVSPDVSSYLINYSTAFPYHDDLSSTDLILYSDTKWDGSSMSLDAGATSGTFVTGVIERGDDPWPQLLELNISGGGTVFVGMIDALSMEYVPGFEPDGSTFRMLEGGWAFPTWEGSYPGDIPEGVKAVLIRVDLVSKAEQDPPVVHGLRTGVDLPPEIIDITCSAPWSVERTLNVTFHIEVKDREQGPDELEARIEVIPPSGGPLSFILQESARNGGTLSWVLEVEGDAPVGTWEIRASVVDRWGQISPEEVREILVLNSLPTPPVISILPPSPVSSDPLELEIVEPGRDSEMNSSELGYIVKWFRDDEFVEEIKSPFRVPSEMTQKGEIWSVEVRVRDDHDVSGPAVSSVIIQNSLPGYLGSEALVMVLDEDTSSGPLDISSLFADIDGDALSFSLTGLEMAGPHLLDGILTLTPDPDWNGEEDGAIEVSDGEDLLKLPIKVVVNGVEDPTENLSIISPTNGTRHYEGHLWSFSCDFRDRDLPYGQELEATWVWNTFTIGKGNDLENIPFPVGDHRVYVLIMEGETAHAMTYVEFNVDAYPDDTGDVNDTSPDDPGGENQTGDGGGGNGDPQDGGDGRNGLDLMYLLPLFLLLLIVMSLIYLLGLITKKRAERPMATGVRQVDPRRRLPERKVLLSKTRQLKPVPYPDHGSSDRPGGFQGTISRRSGCEDNPPLQKEEHIDLPPENPYHEGFQEDTYSYYGPYVWPRNRFNDEERWADKQLKRVSKVVIDDDCAEDQ